MWKKERVYLCACVCGFECFRCLQLHLMNSDASQSFLFGDVQSSSDSDDEVTFNKFLSSFGHYRFSMSFMLQFFIGDKQILVLRNKLLRLSQMTCQDHIPWLNWSTVALNLKCFVEIVRLWKKRKGLVLSLPTSIGCLLQPLPKYELLHCRNQCQRRLMAWKRLAAPQFVCVENYFFLFFAFWPLIDLDKLVKDIERIKPLVTPTSRSPRRRLTNSETHGMIKSSIRNAMLHEPSHLKHVFLYHNLSLKNNPKRLVSIFAEVILQRCISLFICLCRCVFQALMRITLIQNLLKRCDTSRSLLF